MQGCKIIGLGFTIALMLVLGACQHKNNPTYSSPIQYAGPFAFTATPTITTSPTPPLSDFNLSSGAVTTLTTGTYNFNCVNLAAGSVVTIDGGVTLFTQCFTLNAGATIWGARSFGSEYPELMSGHGGVWLCSAGYIASGGGGHGGPGDSACIAVTYESTPCVGCAPGGVSFDDPVHPISMGGRGGNPYTEECSQSGSSSGGCLFKLVVLNSSTNQLNPATINGVIDMGGCPSYFCEIETGGGAGGSILLESQTINGNGSIRANGGSGGVSGGGGIVSLISNTSSFFGTVTANSGGGVANGVVTITAPPLSGY